MAGVWGTAQEVWGALLALVVPVVGVTPMATLSCCPTTPWLLHKHGHSTGTPGLWNSLGDPGASGAEGTERGDTGTAQPGVSQGTNQSLQVLKHQGRADAYLLIGADQLRRTQTFGVAVKRNGIWKTLPHLNCFNGKCCVYELELWLSKGCMCRRLQSQLCG